MSESIEVHNSCAAALKLYLERYEAHSEANANLMQLLASDAVIEDVKALTPRDECEIRLALAEKFERLKREEMPGWQFDALQFAAFFIVPLSKIEDFLGGREQNVAGLTPIIGKLAEATRNFLLKDDPNAKKPNGTGTPSAVGPQGSPASQQLQPRGPKRRIASDGAGPVKKPKFGSQGTPSSASPQFRSTQSHVNPDGQLATDVTRAWRNEKEKEKCRMRDHEKCIITKATDPEVCHIVPFAWNKDEDRRAKTEFFMGALKDMFDVTPAMASKFHGSLGCSDKVWNLVSMSPHVRASWGKAYFGLRPVGELPAVRDSDNPEVSVQLQFVWMPRKDAPNDGGGKKTPAQKVLIDLIRERAIHRQTGQTNIAQPESVISCAAELRGIPVGKRIFDVESTAQIYSGQIIEIQMPFAEAHEFTTAMTIQWTLASIAAISGAAEAVEHDWNPDQDEPGAFPVEDPAESESVDPGLEERVRDWLGSSGSQKDGGGEQESDSKDV